MQCLRMYSYARIGPNMGRIGPRERRVPDSLIFLDFFGRIKRAREQSMPCYPLKSSAERTVYIKTIITS